MNWSGLFQDPIAASIWAAIAAGAGFVAKPVFDLMLVKKKGDVELQKAVIEKSPDDDRVWKDGMIDLMKEQRQEMLGLRDEVASLRREVAELNEHIDNLTNTLKANNITPPVRRKLATEKAD